MKRSRRWRLSRGGAALFLAVLFVPLIVRCLVVLAAKTTYGWMDALVLLCVLLLCSVVWLASIRPLAAEGRWKEPRSWYEAAFALAALFLVFGLYIIAAGRTPSRFNSRPVPRVSGVRWLEMAAVPGAVGIAAYLWEKRRGAPVRGRRA
jgi:hypothetical protein